MKAISILCIIVVLWDCSVECRKCFRCGCEYNWDDNTGSCSSTTFLTTCSLVEVGNQYCHIISRYNGNVEQRIFESIPPDTFQDSHFLQAVEVIALSNTTWLSTMINSIGYGCDWDGCNNMSLAQYLPDSFKIKIDPTILDSQLLNGQLPAQTCYTCSQCINSVTAVLCAPTPCSNGFCYIDEIHNYLVTPANNCTYNFYSSCQSFSNPVQTPNVRIRATYYLDFPQEKQLEIDEIDIVCTKDNCNSISVVEYLKGQVRVNVSLNSDFQPSRINDTTTTTTTMEVFSSTSLPSTTTTTTTTTMEVISPTSLPSTKTTTTMEVFSSTSLPSTIMTTTEGSKSTKIYPMILLYFILTLAYF